MKWTIFRLTVSAEKHGWRLDFFLADAHENLSRTLIKKVIDLGGVHLQGRRVRSCSQPVQNGDRIEVYLDHLPTDPYRIADKDVIYRDPYLIVLNKPAFVDTQPTHARYKGTLYEALQWYLKDPFRPRQKPELGMIQRLDRGTSGLIVFSIHPKAHKKMTQIFLERRVEKRYLALVSGVPAPPEGEIHSYLTRVRKVNRVMSVKRGGKEAITRYRVVESFNDCSLLEINLLTGRSHQIRAHMSEQGCPLLGDQRYAGPKEFHGSVVARPLLHAVRLVFQHPVTGQQLDFTTPVPVDMVAVYENLKKES